MLNFKKDKSFDEEYLKNTYRMYVVDQDGYTATSFIEPEIESGVNFDKVVVEVFPDDAGENVKYFSSNDAKQWCV